MGIVSIGSDGIIISILRRRLAFALISLLRGFAVRIMLLARSTMRYE